VQKIDEVLDDGNLTLGKVHISGAVDNPNYLKLFVVCQ